MNCDIFVIVPCLNEAEVLAETLVPLIAEGYSVVVVDDGSSDETPNILKRLPVSTLRHPINLGQGAALQTGMEFALSRDASYLVHFDADGQHRVEDIERMVAPLVTQEADVTLGSRFLRAQDVEAVPLLKNILLRGARVVNGLFTGMWLTDAHNGFRAMTASAASQVHIAENGYAHASEFLSEVRRKDLRCKEIPITVLYTEYSKAKGQSLWNAFNILFDLVLRRIFKK